MKHLLTFLFITCSVCTHAQDLFDGWYFNPDEPGNGFNVNRQADITGIALFDFTLSGRNQWATAVDEVVVQGDFVIFQANLRAPATGACFECPFMPNSGNESGDVITIEFGLLPDQAGNTFADVTLRGKTERYVRQLFRFSEPMDFLLAEWNLVEVIELSSSTVSFVEIAVLDQVGTSNGEPFIGGRLITDDDNVVVALQESTTGLIFMLATDVVGELDQAWAFIPYKEWLVGFTEVGSDPLTELIQNPELAGELRGSRFGRTIRRSDADDLGEISNPGNLTSTNGVSGLDQKYQKISQGVTSLEYIVSSADTTELYLELLRRAYQ